MIYLVHDAYLLLFIELIRVTSSSVDRLNSAQSPTIDLPGLVLAVPMTPYSDFGPWRSVPMVREIDVILCVWDKDPTAQSVHGYMLKRQVLAGTNLQTEWSSLSFWTSHMKGESTATTGIPFSGSLSRPR